MRNYENQPSTMNRRKFLVMTGALLGSATLNACGPSNSENSGSHHVDQSTKSSQPSSATESPSIHERSAQDWVYLGDYVVQEGDYLAKIVDKFQSVAKENGCLLTARHIADKNGLGNDWNKIYPGQHFRIECDRKNY